MSYIVTNIVPILLAGIAGLGLLALAWRGRGAGAGLLLPAFALLCWLAAILAGALILAPVEAGRWTVALGSAGIIWVGFVLPAVLVTLRSRAVSWGAALADAGLWLAVMLLQAAVLRAVGVVGPTPPTG